MPKCCLSAPAKPLIDVEVLSDDAYADYAVKIKGDKGTYVSTQSDYKYTYIIDGENPPRPYVEGTLRKENGDPCYCSETLIKHEESGKFEGTPFDVGTSLLYEESVLCDYAGKKNDDHA